MIFSTSTQNVRSSSNRIDGNPRSPYIGRTWQRGSKRYTVTELFAKETYTIRVDGPDSVGYFNLTEQRIKEITE